MPSRTRAAMISVLREVMCEGSFVVSGQGAGPGQSLAGADMLRILLENLPEIGNGARNFAVRPARAGAQQVTGPVRSEPDSAVKIGERLFVSVQPLQGFGTAEQCR